MSAVSSRFQNIDSGLAVDEQTLVYALEDSWTSMLSMEVPVYLLSPSTMDRYCRPRCIPVERAKKVRELIGKCVRSVGCDLQKLWEDIDKLAGEECRRYVAMGCFLPKDTVKGTGKPVILICPERVHDAASHAASSLGVGVQDAFRELFRSVLSHEEIHYIIWRLSGGRSTGLYSQSAAARMLEESLAQLGAYFNPSANPLLYQRVMDEVSRLQSLEYNGWRALLLYSSGPGDAREDIIIYADAIAGVSGVHRAVGAVAKLLYPYTATHPLLPLMLPPMRVSRLKHILHHIYWELGPTWHHFYHEVVEPALDGKPHPIEAAAAEVMRLTSLLLE